jgi:hypothetical protein
MADLPRNNDIHKTILTEEAWTRIDTLLAQGLSKTIIGRRFGVTADAIHNGMKRRLARAESRAEDRHEKPLPLPPVRKEKSAKSKRSNSRRSKSKHRKPPRR